ncbi:MAG: DUF2577 domain-containing protein [Clostridium sp.]|nr:DUF2577 domain-containing protein [Clostridium sp.]
MPDAQWIENMKRIMLQAVEAGDPCDVIPGTVISVSPAAVQIDQKITVKGKQVLVPRHLTDHAETMVIPELGEVSVTVKNSLKQGDRVLLLQKKGGQQYLVLDRW